MAYSTGQAWPLLKMSRSFVARRGLAQSKRRYFASSTAIRSAADIPEVGCPDPAAVVQRMLSTRSCAASSFHALSWSDIGASRLRGALQVRIWGGEWRVEGGGRRQGP